MKLEVISPEKVVYTGEAEVITLPGINGSFSVLQDHAPIISILTKGKLSYKTNGQESVMDVDGGFVEVKKNVVTVCVE